MDVQTFTGNYGKPIILDLCYPCGAIWFDGFENLQLTPSSILQLFKLIHEKQALHNKAARQTLAVSPLSKNARAYGRSAAHYSILL